MTCDRCGDVRVSATRAVVFPQTGEFRVDCPMCRQGIVRWLSDELVVALVLGGAEARKVYPALTTDDLIDFHERFDEEIKELLA